MIGTLMGFCILGMFLVGVLVPVGILIYEVVATIKDQIWNKSKVAIFSNDLRNFFYTWQIRYFIYTKKGL